MRGLYGTSSSAVKFALAVILAALFLFAPVADTVAGNTAYAVDTDKSTGEAVDLGVPEHSENLTENIGRDGQWDGTYTMSLDVTGRQIETQTDAPADAQTESKTEHILNQYSYTDVSATEHMSSAVEIPIVSGSPEFKYYKNGKVWKDAPEATYDSTGKLDWDLSSIGKLEEGVTYRISFTVAPKKETADLIRDFKNGSKSYDKSEYPDIVKSEDGEFSVYTNASGSLKYRQIHTRNGEDIQGDLQTSDYDRSQIKVKTSASPAKAKSSASKSPASKSMSSSAPAKRSKDTPPHTKSIAKTNGEDRYKLSLDVTGGQSIELVKPKIDVIFVVDNSHSMVTNRLGSKTRMQVLKEVVTSSGGLTDSILGNSSIDGRLAVVSFYGKWDYNTGGTFINGSQPWDDAEIMINWSSDKTNVNSRINAMNPTSNKGETNYQAGLMKASEILGTARSDAQKILVLLGDGEPSCYYNNQGYTLRGGTSDRPEVNAIYSTFDNLTSLDGFYLVGIDVGVNQQPFNQLAQYASDMGIGSSARYFASTAQELMDSFDAITENIIPHGCKDVTISDKLSEYAELADASSIKVTKITQGQADQVLGSSIVTTSYDATSKTVSAVFRSDYELSVGSRYVLSFDIKPSQKAYDDFAQSGYPSGKDGFPSNDGAELKYRFNEPSQLTTDYEEEPVFKIEPMNISVEKIWQNDTFLDRPAEIVMDLYQDGGSGAYKTITLKNSEGYKGTFTNVAKGQHCYALKERAVSGYKVAITPDNITNASAQDKPGFKVTNSGVNIIPTGIAMNKNTTLAILIGILSVIATAAVYILKRARINANKRR